MNAQLKDSKLQARFWRKVNKDGPIVREDLGACWMWTGCLSNGKWRYGKFFVNGRGVIRASHVIWEMTFGEIDPSTPNVLHRCDNPSCVNPSHLFLGTFKDNTEDMDSKGRRVKRPLPGEKNGMAKLTLDHVREIRLAASAGATYASQSRLYGVTLHNIRSIVMLETWRDV